MSAGAVALGSAGQPLRFVVVGCAGYGLNVVVFALLMRFGVAYVAASVASYLVANALMYVGNRTFTFRLGPDGFLSAYVRYLAVGLVVVALNAILLAGLVEVIGLGETTGQALALLAVTPVAFALFKRWTFRVGGAS